MPPKVMFTKQQIINAALQTVRENGQNGLTARALAARLNCSVKPIFGLFKNMEELKKEVIVAANELYYNYIEKAVKNQKYPPYKSTGMAYIEFASNEKELFKLLFMRDRSKELSIIDDDRINSVLKLLKDKTGFDDETAKIFHLEMWVFVHGIATMVATGFLEWDTQFVSRSLTDCYNGLLSNFKNGNL